MFDKTGTLTKGAIKISNYKLLSDELNEIEFKEIIFSLEKYSNHPIAKAIIKEWKTNNTKAWKKIEEIKGIGMYAEDKDGNGYQLGSYKIAATVTTDSIHTAYLLKNNILIGWLDVDDEIREEAKDVIAYLHSKKIKTYLLSGDSFARCKKVADSLGIDEIYAEKSPEEKFKIVAQLNKLRPTAMVAMVLMMRLH